MDYKAIAQRLVDENHYFIGVRADDRKYNVGDKCELSKDWDYENDCYSDEYLDGTCATEVLNNWNDVDDVAENLKNAIEFNKRYRSKYQYIIVGNGIERGMDENEVIIKNAVVFEVLF